MKRKSAISALRVIGFTLLLSTASLSTPAFAQCEMAASATNSMNSMMRSLTDNIKDFLTQENNYSNTKMSQTARSEVITRFEELDKNIALGLSEWWRLNFNPALKAMAHQLHYAKIDQTMRIGMMMDAQMINETIAVLQKHQAEARNSFQINESMCQVDNVGIGQAKAQAVSEGLVEAWTSENQSRTMNTFRETPVPPNGLVRKAYADDPGEPNIMAAAATGSASEQREIWKEYVKYFCDPAAGDQGCKNAGSLPGQHTNIADLLWGERQTIDLANKDTRRAVNAVQRYLISPRTMDPIPSPVIDSKTGVSMPQGIEQMLKRRSHIARMNTVYNTVGNLVSERASTSKVNLQSMRIKGGAEPADASTAASYREIQEAMSRDRFQDPEFMARMVADPKQLIQEQNSINGMRMQQMADIYKRMEEMVVMETAMAASDLDDRMPK